MVSVIVPIYNVEDFLEDCLESIIHQTETDIEIILINDGSKDKSIDIAKSYAEKDTRIRLIEQENQGLSITRNVGIEAANGDYVLFIDSDDFIDLNCVQTCLEIATKNKVSIISFDAETFNETDSSFSPSYDRKGKMTTKVLKGIDFLIQEKKLVGSINNSSAMKFVKRSLLVENNIRFKPHILQEDILFNYQIMSASDKVIYAPFAFYKRRIREGSIMTSPFDMRNLNSYQITLTELANLLSTSDIKKRLYFAQLFDIMGFTLKNIFRAETGKKEMLKKTHEIYQQIPSLKLKIYLVVELVFRALLIRNPRQIMYKVR